MGFNLFFDVAAIFILSFLIVSVILKRQFIVASNKIYLATVICALAAAILDILASLAEISIPVLTVLNTLFMFLRAATAMLLFFYACNLGRVYHYLKRNRWGYLLLFLPLLVLFVFLIINFFNHCVFVYEPGPQYFRRPLVWIAYLVSYMYLLGGLVVIFISRRYLSVVQIVALIGAFLLQAGASIFQYFVKEILVEMFIAAITMLTLSLFVESPEHFIEPKTLSLNYRAFKRDVQLHIDVHDVFSVLFIRVTNSSALYNLYPHEKALRFNHACSAAVASKVKELDPDSLVYFLGDATFAYVLTNREAEERIHDLIQKEFALPMTHNSMSFLFSSQTSLVHCPEDCSDVSDLMAFASSYYRIIDRPVIDLTPYRKEQGNILFALDHILERAIHEKSFSVYYQGIYSLKENRFTSAEGLLRLHDPQFGTIMPSLMIPYAESYGKIVPIGRIVMEKGCRFFATHLRGKLQFLELNLSPSQLLDPMLSTDISSIAAECGISPQEIIFEITEQAATMDDPTIAYNLRAIRGLGFRLAIDDFGTGFSNLSRLMELDISVLKFDRTLSDALMKGGQDDVFLGLFRAFHKRGVTILFEGVETKEASEKLQAMGADAIQGYYYSKTIPEDEFLALIGD